ATRRFTGSACSPTQPSPTPPPPTRPRSLYRPSMTPPASGPESGARAAGRSAAGPRTLSPSAWTFKSAAAWRRNAASPPHARSRYASHSSGGGRSTAARKMSRSWSKVADIRIASRPARPTVRGGPAGCLQSGRSFSGASRPAVVRRPGDQPGPRELPMPIGGRPGQPEGGGRLLDGEPGEVPELDKLAGHRVVPGQPGQGFIQGQEAIGRQVADRLGRHVHPKP